MITGGRLPPEVTPRRPGDPASCVASVDRIRLVLGWQAKSTLSEIRASAWHAFQRAPA